ncbi:MAG: DUF2092 domain-containing protein [Gammaproteobacteria bacterium]|nr:DUF2092 domain-containing protein [Gammaproteobacteria bacterium]
MAVISSSVSAGTENRIDPEAEQILRSMSAYMGGVSSFKVNADVDHEILDTTGRKLQLTSSVNIAVNRPGNLFVHRQGPVADVELFFDGSMLTIHGKGLNIYTQLGASGSIDDAIGQLRAETGIDAPGGDLLFADPYPGLVDGLVSAVYMGSAFVNGVECHHLAVREEQVDWQLWVQAGNRPLPMKYIITSKWITGAPQYSVRFRDWNIEASVSAEQFRFSAPDGARKLDSIPVDEMGEFNLEGDR